MPIHQAVPDAGKGYVSLIVGIMVRLREKRSPALPLTRPHGSDTLASVNRARLFCRTPRDAALAPSHNYSMV